MTFKTIAYIIDFLARFQVSDSGIIHYGRLEEITERTKILIISAFSNLEIKSLPETPFKLIDHTPVLYGDSKIEKQNGILIIYADIIASAFFLLSRYEEILKPECRDQHGRFCAKDSIIFQQGYGNRPLVDEYSFLFRNWLREAGIDIPAENHGFSKIYLTHDVDVPFRFERLWTSCKQIVKNLMHYNYCASPIKKYLNVQHDDYYTFPKIIEYDKGLQKSLPKIPVESIYFIITAGSVSNNKYYNFSSKKTSHLIEYLKSSGGKLGLHVSYEGGVDPKIIKSEAIRLKEMLKSNTIISRHHFLQWREPEDILLMEKSGITDDFTLSYADCAGFRVGTCHPYRFINPLTRELTNVMIHPFVIMECTLDRKEYMNLNYENAFEKCKEIINQVYKHNGELVLLWHNTEFLGKNYQEKLYKNVLGYIKNL